MRKIKSYRDKVLLHPMMAFLFMSFVIIVLSGILDLFGASVTYNKINISTGDYESTLVTVESLLNLSGIKYIFSNTVSNFASFTPLSMLLITLLGIGIMDKTGFLDTMFFLLTKKIKKTTVTFFLVLICMLLSISGDLSFIVMIPLAALLFKYGKRNPIVGIITAFASLGFGTSINLFLNSIESGLITYSEAVARTVTPGYAIDTYAYLFIMFVLLVVGSFTVTYITEKIIAPKLGKYEAAEESEVVELKEKLTRRELRGLIFALIGFFLYLIVFVYNIIPNVPFGGSLLDYSQDRYIDMLFGYDSFFNSGFVFVITFAFVLMGLLYGLGTKKINNHRDICDNLSHSLDGIGKVIVLIFFASMFISLLKYTNIGTLVTALSANIIQNSGWGGIPLILLVYVLSFVSALLTPNYITRWAIMSDSVVTVMWSQGFSPEFAQLVFSAGSSLGYAITPAMAYFVIYLAYIEKYDGDGCGMNKSISYLIPYCLAFAGLWIVILILWYLVGLPLGIGTSTII